MVVTSLLVRLSAQLLQWQNPGEASALLLHNLGAKWRQQLRQLFRQAGTTRMRAAVRGQSAVQRSSMQSP
jgi:hypothetical protein